MEPTHLDIRSLKLVAASTDAVIQQGHSRPIANQAVRPHALRCQELNGLKGCGMVPADCAPTARPRAEQCETHRRSCYRQNLPSIMPSIRSGPTWREPTRRRVTATRSAHYETVQRNGRRCSASRGHSGSSGRMPPGTLLRARAQQRSAAAQAAKRCAGGCVEVDALGTDGGRATCLDGQRPEPVRLSGSVTGRLNGRHQVCADGAGGAAVP